MDSCPLAAITETPRGNDLSKDGNEVEVTSLEEAKSVIAALRARQRAQAHQMLAWRRTLKLQVRREIRKKKKKRTRNNSDQSEPRRATSAKGNTDGAVYKSMFSKSVCNDFSILYFFPILTTGSFLQINDI